MSVSNLYTYAVYTRIPERPEIGFFKNNFYFKVFLNESFNYYYSIIRIANYRVNLAVYLAITYAVFNGENQTYVFSNKSIGRNGNCAI